MTRNWDTSQGQPAQLTFPFTEVDDIERCLQARTGLRVVIVLTNNVSTMLSVKKLRAGKGVQLRLHRMFLAAPKKVIDAVADWVEHPRSAQAGAVIDAFIEQNRHCIRRRRESGAAQPARGVCHDLQQLFDEVNQTEFGGAVSARIMWGRMPRARRRRSIRFGSYTSEENLIRIHPLLDQPHVPRFFVRYIVFHEMLHAYLGIERTASGRRRIHTRAFREREKAYPDYERALAWLNDSANLRRLLK